MALVAAHFFRLNLMLSFGCAGILSLARLLRPWSYFPIPRVPQWQPYLTIHKDNPFPDLCEPTPFPVHLGSVARTLLVVKPLSPASSRPSAALDADSRTGEVTSPKNHD